MNLRRTDAFRYQMRSHLASTCSISTHFQESGCVWVLGPEMNMNRVIVDPGNGQVLSKTQVSLQHLKMGMGPGMLAGSFYFLTFFDNSLQVIEIFFNYLYMFNKSLICHLRCLKHSRSHQSEYEKLSY